jgi:hypothetical protein
MIRPILNLFKLIRILRERGNRPLIRHSRKQLLNFVLCRGDMNRKSPLRVIPYWFYMLRGLDALVWRLETFGFLFVPGLDGEQKRRLDKHVL